MNTARIMVLTIAISTCGTVACLADGPAHSKPAHTEPVAQTPAPAGIDTARSAIVASMAALR